MNGDAPLAGDVGSAEVNVYTYILYTFGIGTISFERSCKGIEMVYCGVSSYKNIFHPRMYGCVFYQISRSAALLLTCKKNCFYFVNFNELLKKFVYVRKKQ
mgnify:CR=1 FL=1